MIIDPRGGCIGRGRTVSTADSTEAAGASESARYVLTIPRPFRSDLFRQGLDRRCGV